jgi:hypothetical protein
MYWIACCDFSAGCRPRRKVPAELTQVFAAGEKFPLS